MHIHLILIKLFKFSFLLSRIILKKLPWLHVGPAKPGSHWQVNELDVFGIQVPCLLHTSVVHTRFKNEEKSSYQLLYIPCAFVKLLKNKNIRRILMNIKNDVRLLIDVIV